MVFQRTIAVTSLEQNGCNMETTITLVVNGKIEDYDTHLRQVIASVVAELSPLQNTQTDSFTIVPEMSYRLSDPKIIEFFGCQDIKKNPVLAIATRLRSLGIEPQSHGRSGTSVFGSQLLEYKQRAEDKTCSYLRK